ncbi:hypothetical protein PHYSODRAFT_467022, partial [Phytophthora sojae]
FIVHRAYCKKKKIKAMTHVRFMCKLHLQLIALKPEDMYEENTFQPDENVSVDVEAEERQADTGSHIAKQSDEWRDHSGQRKRVQKNCKVCTLKTPSGKRGATYTYFCDGCDFPGPIYLCVKPKWTVGSKMLSCWDVWHKEYNNGKAIPQDLKGKIRVRAPKATSSPGKSPAKRRCVSSVSSEVSEDSE